MSAVRDCPGCGRGHIKGKRVLFPTQDGRLVRKLVCLSCAARAERVFTRVTAKPCMVAKCTNAAHVCTHHAAEEVERARKTSVEGAVLIIRAMLQGLRHVAPKANDEQIDYLAGKAEGLAAALEALERRGVKKEIPS